VAYDVGLLIQTWEQQDKKQYFEFWSKAFGGKK